jgi:hypothetical protein
MKLARGVFIFGVACLWLVAAIDLARPQVPASTDEIAHVIGMCTIQRANLADQLDQANAKIKELQRELDELKKAAAAK